MRAGTSLALQKNVIPFFRTPLFIFSIEKKKYLDASMGCLKLSYYETESCLPEASPLGISYVNGEVREEKEYGFLGVVDQQNNGNVPGDGPNWQAGWEAFVQAFVPFGSDIYPPKPNGIIAATVPDLPISPRGSAKLAINGVKLAKQLASEAQMAEKGIIIIGSGKLTQAERLAQQYGGNAADWVKKSSSSYSLGPAQFETHWYENVVNWLRVEFKTVFPK